MINSHHAFLRSRRSIRHFRHGPIPAEALDRILNTAIYAPSAHNNQPWRFVVLVTSAAKSHLIEKLTGKFHDDMALDGVADCESQERIDRTTCRINEAPVIIVLCQDLTQVNPQPDKLRRDAEILMGTQSVALAGLQLLLAAHAEGLGGTWICWPLFAPEETRQSLDLPSEWDPQGMIFLGYPAEEPKIPGRKSLESIAVYK